MKASGPPGKPIFTLLQAEERRALRDFLSVPFAGYLLKPLRRSTLLRQLPQSDDQTIASAVKDLRRMTSSAEKKAPHLNILLAEDNPVNALLARTLLEKIESLDPPCDQWALRFSTILPRAEDRISSSWMSDAGTRRARNGAPHQNRARLVPAIPILALTANASAADEAECLAAGMSGHIVKPFDRQDLDEAIAALTAKRPAA